MCRNILKEPEHDFGKFSADCGKTLLTSCTMWDKMRLVLSRIQLRGYLKYMYDLKNRLKIRRFFFVYEPPARLVAWHKKLSFPFGLESFYLIKFWWWGYVDLNHRPRHYQWRALTSWAISPWWSNWDSNPGPLPCKGSALISWAITPYSC